MAIDRLNTENKPAAMGDSDYLRNQGYEDVSIEVNDQCNFHCIYCPYDTDETHKFAVMDRAKAEEIIDGLAEDGSLDGYLLFNVLGEPLMYSDLFNLIKYANVKGIKTKVVTNGSLLTQKNIDGLIESNPTMIKISVESLDPAVFHELRGTTIKFETYVNRISNMVARAIAEGPAFQPYLQLDIMYSNWKVNILKRACGLETCDHGRKRTYTDKSKLTNDVIDFVRPLIADGRWPGMAITDLPFDDTVFEDNLKPFLSLAPNVAFHIKPYWRWDDIFARKYPVANDGRGCDLPNIGIHADGDVVLCCIDYNASNVLGNVFQQSLREILTKEKNMKIIQDLRNGIYHFEACQSCQGHTTLVGKYVYGAVRQKNIRKVLSSTKAKVNVLARGSN